MPAPGHRLCCKRVLAALRTTLAFGSNPERFEMERCTVTLTIAILATITAPELFAQSQTVDKQSIPSVRQAVSTNPAPARNETIKQTLLQSHESLAQDLSTLEAYFQELSSLNEQLALQVSALQRTLSDCSGKVQTREVASGTTSSLTQQTRESLSRQTMELLALQQKMQQQNRQYTTLSNVMKTRHDTAKSTINNIR